MDQEKLIQGVDKARMRMWHERGVMLTFDVKVFGAYLAEALGMAVEDADAPQPPVHFVERAADEAEKQLDAKKLR